ncbi:hypothetical protein [Streptomyces sp. NBC_00887]|uniref:hypothetical protein n=1 Tax=Streptomyces sp. NBC_00887 TaxID=2975859 RepID=UPI00386D264E|nr:hypothetical protein OG844_01540 [Streptomyces sp. NBC_00887]WSY36163.1 hypothetical protein OG844_44060 [Streptomyces sp. NBC_00887]
MAALNAGVGRARAFLETDLADELELLDLNVRFTMPGPTEMDFFHRAGMDDTKVGRQSNDDPALVAEQGLDVFFAGKNKIVAGSVKTEGQGRASVKTEAQGLAHKVLPDAAKAEAHREMAEPGSGERDGTE